MNEEFDFETDVGLTSLSSALTRFANDCICSFLLTLLCIVTEDDNIRLISNDNDLQSNMEMEFKNKMAQYISDATKLDLVLSALTPEMVRELIHNWDFYQPSIRKLRGKFVNDILFVDMIHNMLLEKVNQKYSNTSIPSASTQSNLADYATALQTAQLKKLPAGASYNPLDRLS